MTKQLLDQSAHVAAALVGLVPLALAPSPLTGVWAGFLMGLVRELTEEGSRVRLAHFGAVARSAASRLDIAFWTLGGFIAGTMKELI